MVGSVGYAAAFATSGVAKSAAPKSTNPVESPKNSESRVDTIAKQIKEGSYRVDISALAKKIAEELI